MLHVLDLLDSNPVRKEWFQHPSVHHDLASEGIKKKNHPFSRFLFTVLLLENVGSNCLYRVLTY